MKPLDSLRRNVAHVVYEPASRADLLNAFPVPVWICDAHGDCVFVNQAWQDFTGRSLTSYLGTAWGECIHPLDRAGMFAAWEQALGLRRPFSHSYRVRRADGEFGWVHDEGLPVDDEQGRLAGYLGVCHDIDEQRRAQLDAIDKESQVRMLADNVPALIASFEAETLRCLFANKAYARMWDHDERTVVGKTVGEVIGEAGMAEIGPYIERARRGETVMYERSIRTSSGAEHTLEVNLLPQNDESGRTVAAFVLVNDITRHRRAEQAVRESEARMRKFAEATHAGIIFHEDGLVTDCNDAILRLTGYKFDELVGTAVIQYVSPDFRDEALANVASGYERPYESEIIRRDGTRLPVEFEGRAVPWQGKVLRLSVVRDISRRRASQARIDYMAHHDLLTGLPNRALLLDRMGFALANARRRGTQVALLFIDLDNFKTVNDSLGHMAGDLLLKVIAARVKGVMRSGDVVSRHGGDEFLVVLPDIEGERGPIPVAEKLLATIGEPMDIEGQSISVSPSIGISLFPRDGGTPELLIRNADAAMYLAKARGRNNFQFFDERLSQAATRALTLEARMREAIRDGEYRLHYQPQMRVDSGALVGVEALIRWPQPDGSFIEPNEFIPIAEQRGVIRPIGSWVLREACRQNRAWQDAGLPPVPVSVNLSVVQFRQRDLLVEVETVLRETGLDPRFLAFELTESMLMDDSAEMLATLEGFKAMGVRLAIDDFGTGHSSLMHLKRYPIDKLKIDRTFIADAPGDPDDRAIIGAIIDLARNMGITSIAEGVDRVEQLDFLRSRGCEEVQGHLFARAMPPDQAAGWIGRPRTGTITAFEAGPANPS